MDLGTLHNNNNDSLKHLIDLGSKGYFPLFHPSWIEEACTQKDVALTDDEKEIIKNVVHRLQKHRSIDRKKTLIMSLAPRKRQLFIRSFLLKVEDIIKGGSPKLH